MKIKVLGFGIVREIFGASSVEAELPDNPTVTDLTRYLEQKYPQLIRLVSYRVACDDHYANPTDSIGEAKEVAVIPPVSGG